MSGGECTRLLRDGGRCCGHGPLVRGPLDVQGPSDLLQMIFLTARGRFVLEGSFAAEFLKNCEKGNK
jgi:hypothetical protein